MKSYPDYVDNIIIDYYESDLISDFKIPPPEQSKSELDSDGCFFDSNLWNDNLSEKDIIHKMIFNNKMRIIWPALTKRASECQLPTIFYKRLAAEINEAYIGPSDWELLTQKQKEDKIEKIKKLSFELCKEISNTPLDLSVMNFANHKSFFERFKLIANNKIQNENINYYLDKFCMRVNDNYIPKNNNDAAVGWAWASVGVTSPSIGSVLLDINERTKNFECDSILKRKNQIMKVFFIRKISMFFLDIFETPLHNITAVISGVFLDEDISIDEVRSITR